MQVLSKVTILQRDGMFRYHVKIEQSSVPHDQFIVEWEPDVPATIQPAPDGKKYDNVIQLASNTGLQGRS